MPGLSAISLKTLYLEKIRPNSSIPFAFPRSGRHAGDHSGLKACNPTWLSGVTKWLSRDSKKMLKRQIYLKLQAKMPKLWEIIIMNAYKVNEPRVPYAQDHSRPVLNDTEILDLLHNDKVNWEYLTALKALSGFNDDVLARLLNISVKTFRAYKKPGQEISAATREHVVLLLGVFRHGISVFGSKEFFEQWLNASNFYFGGKVPLEFMRSITGIHFVNDRLTAMEYGDNV